jgi:hypothetical protein
VYTYYSGIPFTATWGSESSLLDPYGYATAVPNVVGKVHYVHKPSCWFYASATQGCAPFGAGLSDAFADAGNGVVGNGSRNSLNSPATDVFDAALIKDFPITENVLNHPLFAAPGGDISTGAAAQITSLSGDPRVMQFALRVDF